jgi:predicted RNA binding protein YcfA (HicA-like mRNA interferase family)
MAARKEPRRWERLLMVLANGGIISKEQIGATMQYDAMYRISTEMWWLKKQGAVVRTHKTGRAVSGYELMNVKEMIKVLKDRGFAPLDLVAVKTKAVKVTKAVAKPAAKTKTKPVKSMDELKTQATEVTEQVTEVSTDDVVEITE